MILQKPPKYLLKNKTSINQRIIRMNYSEARLKVAQGHLMYNVDWTDGKIPSFIFGREGAKLDSNLVPGMKSVPENVKNIFAMSNNTHLEIEPEITKYTDGTLEPGWTPSTEDYNSNSWEKFKFTPAKPIIVTDCLGLIREHLQTKGIPVWWVDSSELNAIQVVADALVDTSVTIVTGLNKDFIRELDILGCIVTPIYKSDSEAAKCQGFSENPENDTPLILELKRLVGCLEKEA